MPMIDVHALFKVVTRTPRHVSVCGDQEFDRGTWKRARRWR
jgi:hypothetical protein